MASCCSDRKTVRSEENKHALTLRINRLIGQMSGIKRMIEEDRYCEDVLVQLSAVYKAVKGLAAVILEQHMHSCMVEDVQKGEFSSIEEIVDLFRRFS